MQLYMYKSIHIQLKQINTMSKPKEEINELQKLHILPLSTEIDIICLKKDRVIKITKTFEEALKMDKKEGWKYIFYQKGFFELYRNKIKTTK